MFQSRPVPLPPDHDRTVRPTGQRRTDTASEVVGFFAAESVTAVAGFVLTLPGVMDGLVTLNQTQNLYCPSTSLQENVSYGAQ